MAFRMPAGPGLRRRVLAVHGAGHRADPQPGPPRQVFRLHRQQLFLRLGRRRHRLCDRLQRAAAGDGVAGLLLRRHPAGADRHLHAPQPEEPEVFVKSRAEAGTGPSALGQLARPAAASCWARRCCAACCPAACWAPTTPSPPLPTFLKTERGLSVFGTSSHRRDHRRSLAGYVAGSYASGSLGPAPDLCRPRRRRAGDGHGLYGDSGSNTRCCCWASRWAC